MTIICIFLALLFISFPILSTAQTFQEGIKLPRKSGEEHLLPPHIQIFQGGHIKEKLIF